ncbi:MAG: hypothetical protein IT438_05620 [Phycisphaerales bacterium]|nr:hypothetical protein [Phycisphaerales bacterium]
MSRTHRHCPKPARRAPVVAAGALAVVLASTLTGCYERVVSAHGFGADQYNVSEPYQSQSAVDDWLFGKQERTKKTLLPGE